MKNPIQDILDELGWKPDSFKIPVANEENKSLENQIEQKINLKAKLKSDIECIENLITKEKENVRRFENEYEQNKRLIAACSARIEMEKNLYNLAQNEKLKITRDIQDFDKERINTNIKTDEIEGEIKRLKRKVLKLEQKIKRNHNYLLRSEEEIDQNEKRTQSIEDITVSDDKMLRESERRRVKLRDELESLKHELNKNVDEMHELEIVLENTTKLLSEVSAEHLQMIRHSTQSVMVLFQKDKDIEESMNEINSMSEISQQKKKEIEENNEFLHNLMTDNNALEIEVNEMSKTVCRQKEEHRKCVELNGAFHTEILVRKNEIQNFGRNTENTRNGIKQKVTDIEKKKVSLNECNRKIRELTNKFGEIKSRETDVSYKTQQLEHTLENEIKREDMMLKRLKHFQNQVLISTNRIIELDDKLRMINNQESVAIKKAENLDMQKKKSEKLLCSKKEDICHFGSEINKYEKELQRIIGIEEDITEMEKKKQRIEQLNKIYNDKLDESKRLQKLNTFLENDLRQLTNCLIIGNERLTSIKSKKHELVLNMEGSEKLLKVIQSKNEDKQVMENILRLKVFKADKLLSKIDEKVYDLEKYKLEIQMLLQDRKTDITLQKETLVLEKRLHMTKFLELSHLISERKIRIQQLQNRYYNYVATFGNEQDADKPLQSTTYLKIQSAQEKFFLKEQGDNLDQAIRKCEQEIESMENTLKIVNVCNKKYKSNLSLVDDEGPENTQKNKLKNEMYQFMINIRQHKKRSQEIQLSLEKMQNDHKKLMKELEDIKEEKEKKIDCLSAIDKQIIEQKNKISRAIKSIKRLLTFIQNMCTCDMKDSIIFMKKDVELREIEELNSLALQRLAEFMIKNVEAEAYVKKLLSEKSINLPTAYQYKPSPSSSRCGNSITSDMESHGKNERFSEVSSSRGSVSSIINIQPPW